MESAPLSEFTVDDVLAKVGVMAMDYLPTHAVDDPSYRLGRDVDWCMHDVSGLDDWDTRILRDAIGRAIIDPSGYRLRLAETLQFLQCAGAAGAAVDWLVDEEDEADA